MSNEMKIYNWKCERCESTWATTSSEEKACPFCSCVVCGKEAMLRPNRIAFVPETRYYPHCKEHMPREIKVSDVMGG